MTHATVTSHADVQVGNQHAPTPFPSLTSRPDQTTARAASPISHVAIQPVPQIPRYISPAPFAYSQTFKSSSVFCSCLILLPPARTVAEACMCCCWTMDTAPVCLDLMVGRPMDREPSPARCTGMGTEADIASSACGRAPSMTNDEVFSYLPA